MLDCSVYNLESKTFILRIIQATPANLESFGKNTDGNGPTLEHGGL